MSIKAYLEITMNIDAEKRVDVAKVYNNYKKPFLSQIKGALSKELLIRKEDVQVLHGFASEDDAKNYLNSEMFKNDVFVGLKDLWSSNPEVKIYTVA